MDRITQSYTEQFRQEQALGDVDASVLFEHFSNFCVVSETYDDEFDVAAVHVGGENDLGLDGVAIVVNGVIVSNIDEAQDLLDRNGYLEVTFIIVQAKTTSGFSGEKIASFMDGVETFFSDSPTLPMSDTVRDAHELAMWIYDNSIKFRTRKPVLQLAYVTTGQWMADAHLAAVIDGREARLRQLGLFAEIHFLPWGADEIQASYQRSKTGVEAEFTFSTRVVLPDIEGVTEAYLGLVPASEFLSLVSDAAGNLRRSLFNDNVRDFQDYNQVNAEIRETLRDASLQQRFAALNNGVTIVTRGLQATGNRFLLTDFQIVNGCQTSHVLFDERDSLTPAVFVPIKVIATSDEDVVNSIITATNRQTEVTTEDLLAFGNFQRKLEAYFEAWPDKKKLHYERRSRQFSAVPVVEKVRIVSKQQLIRAFAAMFLDDPHRAMRYYSDLFTQVGSGIFVDAHKLEPYYAAAYGAYKLEYLFRNGLLPVYYKPARYELLMAFRYIVGGQSMPALESNQIERYCKSIFEALWDDTKAQESFKTGIAAVDQALAGAPLTRDSVKTQAFTDAVKAALGVPLARHSGKA